MHVSGAYINKAHPRGINVRSAIARLVCRDHSLDDGNQAWTRVCMPAGRTSEAPAVTGANVF